MEDYIPNNNSISVPVVLKIIRTILICILIILLQKHIETLLLLDRYLGPFEPFETAR